MSDEFKSVREAEVEAWERCAQQYQFAYAFIRLRDAGQERDWINSFGELALERSTESRTLFVFFSDLELAIVTKILDRNVRTLNKDKAALEVLVGAWFQSTDDKLEQPESATEKANEAVAEICERSAESERRLFDSTFADKPDHKATYRQSLERFSQALRTAAKELESVDAAETVLNSIEALTDLAAQHGSVRLYRYLSDVSQMANKFRGEKQLFDLYAIESLRDCLTHVKALISVLLPTVGGRVSDFDTPLQTPSEASLPALDVSRFSSVDSQKGISNRLVKLGGYLKIDSRTLRDFEKEFEISARHPESVRKYALAAGRLERHADELQVLLKELSTVAVREILDSSLNKTFFTRADALLPLCCKFEGDGVCVPLETVAVIQDCFEFLYDFLNQLPDSFDLLPLCEGPITVSLRQSSVDVSILFDCSNNMEQWQLCVQMLAEHLQRKQMPKDLVTTTQLASGLLLKFPIESATSQNLLVESAGERVALSPRTLIETGRVEAQRVQKVGSKRFVPFRDEVIPLISLSHVLKFDRFKKNTTQNLSSESERPHLHKNWLEFVIAKISEDWIAFEVDAVLGQHEMVVRDLSKIVPKFDGLLGVSVLEDDKVSMVLDIGQLMATHELNRGEHARKAS